MRRTPIALGLLAVVVACAPAEELGPRGPGWEALPPEAQAIEDVSTPVQGGTLLRLASGTVAAADIDGDALVFLDSGRGEVVGEVILPEHSEPGRLVEGADGEVHVVLRRGGSVATVDPVTLELLAVHPVCEAPRGLDVDPVDGSLWVACEAGELAHLDPVTGSVDVSLLRPDLRDVVVDRSDGLLWVSLLKSAELLRVDHDGQVLSTRAIGDWVEPNGTFGADDTDFAAMVAWRMVPDLSSGVWVLHQRGTRALIDIEDRGDREDDRSPYGGNTDVERRGGIQHAALTFVGGQSMQTSVVIDRAPVAVDLALAPDGDFALAVAGARSGTRAAVPVVKIDPDEALDTDALFVEPRPALAAPVGGDPLEHPTDSVVVAVTYDADGRLISQGQQPFRLWVDGVEVSQREHGATDRAGFLDFHRNAQVGVSCAGCHPEGREDGHVWAFSTVGPRRSQQLGGGLLDTAPFHWDGEFSTLGGLVHEVFERRMGGTEMSAVQVDALGEYLDALPAPHVVSAAEPQVIEQGRALFYSSEVGCADCHSGPALTNSLSYDVGTGERTQVPTLIGVANRLPVMHDGCAETLRDRFTDDFCGGGDAHGTTSHLTVDEVDALVAFLEGL